MVTPIKQWKCLSCPTLISGSGRKFCSKECRSKSKICQVDECGNSTGNRVGICESHYILSYRAARHDPKYCEICGEEIPRRGGRYKKCLKYECKRISVLINRYGMSYEFFQSLIVKQDNCCAICPRSFDDFRIHVDHDHACCGSKYGCVKCVRGLLCPTCNAGIGFLQDDPEILESAARYLRG